MALSDRLANAREASASKLQAVDVEAIPDFDGTVSAANDAFTDIKIRTSELLFERLGSRVNDASLTQDQLHEIVREELAEIIEAEQQLLSPEERRRLLRDVENDAIGLGPLERLLDDPEELVTWARRAHAVALAAKAK